MHTTIHRTYLLSVVLTKQHPRQYPSLQKLKSQNSIPPLSLLFPFSLLTRKSGPTVARGWFCFSLNCQAKQKNRRKKSIISFACELLTKKKVHNPFSADIPWNPPPSLGKIFRNFKSDVTIWRSSLKFIKGTPGTLYPENVLLMFRKLAANIPNNLLRAPLGIRRGDSRNTLQGRKHAAGTLQISCEYSL